MFKYQYCNHQYLIMYDYIIVTANRFSWKFVQVFKTAKKKIYDKRKREREKLCTQIHVTYTSAMTENDICTCYQAMIYRTMLSTTWAFSSLSNRVLYGLAWYYCISSLHRISFQDCGIKCKNWCCNVTYKRVWAVCEIKN